MCKKSHSRMFGLSIKRQTNIAAQLCFDCTFSSTARGLTIMTVPFLEVSKELELRQLNYFIQST